MEILTLIAVVVIGSIFGFEIGGIIASKQLN